MRQRSLRSALAAQHPSNFCHAFILLHNQNRAGCALSALVFRHLEVVMRTGRHLRQVGHRQHLPISPQLLHQPSYGFGDCSTHAGVHLVKNERRCCSQLAGCDRNGERNARQLAARCDLADGLGCHAGVPCDQEHDIVNPIG